MSVPLKFIRPIDAVIAATSENALLRNDIYDRPPVKRWSGENVTLLGDAAHPMTPNLGQGACQAIEDAVVLADCLQKMLDLGAALREYELKRIARTSRLVEQSRQLGEMGQWTNPLACRLRNTLVKHTPPAIAMKQMAALFRFQI